jgi:predicted transcriptional regulator
VPETTSSVLCKFELESSTTMATAKEQITELVQQQPDDSSYDEIIRELTFHLMIERGIDDSDNGRTISNEEMEARINTWLK